VTGSGTGVFGVASLSIRIETKNHPSYHIVFDLTPQIRALEAMFGWRAQLMIHSARVALKGCGRGHLRNHEKRGLFVDDMHFL
jgi:hypothetical protein